MLRVLYAIANYPQLSETYITAEIAFMLRNNVDVRVWSPIERVEGVEPQVQVYRSSLYDAVKDFDPDVVHVHYLMFAAKYDALLGQFKQPMTVRGHSFDWSPAQLQACSRIARVRKIFLYPHFARQVSDPKVVAMPVAFDQKRFMRYDFKDRSMVLRLAAGRPGKGLEDFFVASKLCQGFKFVMGVAMCDDDPLFIDRVAAKVPGHKVTVFKNVGWDSALQLTRVAAIYFDTSDPVVQSFGMPISIAESMSTGAVCLIRDTVAAREYAGDAGLYYNTPQEAADTINSSLAWNSDLWLRLRERSILQSELYADTAVLPVLLHTWEELASRRR